MSSPLHVWPQVPELARRRFSFSPPIAGIANNEWTLHCIAADEAVVRNVATQEELSIPRRFVGNHSHTDRRHLIPLELPDLRQAHAQPRPHPIFEALHDAPSILQRPSARNGKHEPSNTNEHFTGVVAVPASRRTFGSEKDRGYAARSCSGRPLRKCGTANRRCGAGAKPRPRRGMGLGRPDRQDNESSTPLGLPARPADGPRNVRPTPDPSGRSDRTSYKVCLILSISKAWMMSPTLTSS